MVLFKTWITDMWGYQWFFWSYFALDVDECRENVLCDQFDGICMNLPGTFQCSCKHGYMLMTDNQTCQGNWYFSVYPFHVMQ